MTTAARLTALQGRLFEFKATARAIAFDDAEPGTVRAEVNALLRQTDGMGERIARLISQANDSRRQG